MTVTLQDPACQRDPSSRHAFPDVVGEPKMRAPRTLAEELLATFRSGGATSGSVFEVQSHGGYARTVMGKVAYLDEQAQTFMIRVPDGGLVRVPLRDVTSADIRVSTERDGSGPERDVDGLGTGSARAVDRTARTTRIG